jgi:hypothetical protein
LLAKLSKLLPNWTISELSQGILCSHEIPVILITSAGVKHPAQNTSLKPLYFFLIMFKFQSSAIENISEIQDEQVTITFNGGREYTYKVADPDNFVAQLNEVISNDKSVGSFVNSAIRGDQLQNVTV